MNRFQHAGRVSAVVAMTCALSACGLFNKAPEPQPTQPRAWQDESIYFALTDRFANGDVGNDNGADRNAADRADKTNPLGWHGGDWKGIQQKIESGYFKKLGFTALWISPVVLQVPSIPVADGPNKGKSFAGYHGYWADDFFKTDPHFGTQADLKALVESAHRNGLKVIQDVVVNHAGYNSSLTVQHREWFRINEKDKLPECGSDDVTTCLADLPDFRQELPAVTTYLNDFVTYWKTNVGIDGLRIDTMKHVTDDYWKQFFAAGGAGDPTKLWSVGEVFNGDPAFVARYMDVLGSPSVFDFPLYFAVKDNLSSASGSLDALADTLARDSAYKDPSRLTTFIDNHDVPRFVSEVLNRGGSQAEAAQRLDLALSLMYASRGTPSVYQGTELAQAGKGDPYNYVLGESNREDMNFAAVDGSPTAARLSALAAARSSTPALRRGVQQELWRPNGGAPVYAFRRVLNGADPVVAVMNNGATDLDLSTLPGGGIPLLGTFAGTALKELTGRASTMSVQGGKLVGTVPARSLLMVSGNAGTGAGTTVNPALAEVTGLKATPGDGAAGLTWTAAGGADVSGYRVYQSAGGAAERLLNFAPLPASTVSYVARGLSNGVAYTFRVVAVDAQGRESKGVSATATPSDKNTVKVSFTVDARSQGNGVVELRRFDTGSQIAYPMTQVSRGVWKTDLDLPLYREIKFKFGNVTNTVKNSSYEGPGQPDRSLNVLPGAVVSGTYDFITKPVPTTVIEGKVMGAGAPVAGALVEGNDPNLDYAYTFADGTYTLLGSGAQNLKASAAGFVTSAAQSATAPASNVNFDLARDLRTRYTIDGDLSDWKAPKLTLASPAVGGFGADNNWLTLQADSDDTYLYLAYTYRVSGNSAILYLDTQAGGALKADGFDAWQRAADLAGGAEYFIARYQGDAAQLRRIDSDTKTTELPAGGYLQASKGTVPEQSFEAAIPWTSLGYTGKPSTPLKLFGGIFGGDGYGAGDIVPDAGSTPPGANTIGSDPEKRRARFTEGLTLNP